MGRFSSTAERYEQYRQSYPPEFFRAVAGRLNLSDQHALIDLGTGPGLLALGFAPYVGHVVGVDPEPKMIAAAREAARRAGQTLRLIEGRAEDLPHDIGRFDVVTIGRALHWMNGDALGPLFDRLVADGGAIVVCAPYSARDGRNPWLEPYNEARRAWSNPKLWAESLKGELVYRDLPSALGGGAFFISETINVEATHQVRVADLAHRVLTFSPSAPAALGDKADAMLADIEARLLPFSRDGVITEVVVSHAQVARRKAQET